MSTTQKGQLADQQELLSSQLCSQDLQAIKAASGLKRVGYVLENRERQLCHLGLLRVGTDSPASLSHQALPGKSLPAEERWGQGVNGMWDLSGRGRAELREQVSSPEACSSEYFSEGTGYPGAVSYGGYVRLREVSWKRALGLISRTETG